MVDKKNWQKHLITSQNIFALANPLISLLFMMFEIVLGSSRKDGKNENKINEKGRKNYVNLRKKLFFYLMNFNNTHS
jgi:hypothetical protein